MQAQIQVVLTVEEARLLHDALADRVETLRRMGYQPCNSEMESIVLMRGTLGKLAGVEVRSEA